MARILGIDPGLKSTGWGMIEVEGNVLKHLGHGVVTSTAKFTLPDRLDEIYVGLKTIINTFDPDEAAVEEIFVNQNPASALKLGMARGVVLLAPARAGLDVAEYSANKIKKSVVGAGHANKEQIVRMVQHLLPGCHVAETDAADALAIAICHAHYRTQVAYMVA